MKCLCISLFLLLILSGCDKAIDITSPQSQSTGDQSHLAISHQASIAATITLGDSGIIIDNRQDSLNPAPKEYRWIRIGNQLWMRDNLGFALPDSASLCPSSYETYCEEHGLLYNRPGILTGTNDQSVHDQIEYLTDTLFQGICPDDWRIPRKSDAEALAAYVDSVTGEPGESSKHLRSTYGWYQPGLDSFGFEGVAGITCEDYNTCNSPNQVLTLWTSTPVLSGMSSFLYSGITALLYPGVSNFRVGAERRNETGPYRALRCMKDLGE